MTIQPWPCAISVIKYHFPKEEIKKLDEQLKTHWLQCQLYFYIVQGEPCSPAFNLPGELVCDRIFSLAKEAAEATRRIARLILCPSGITMVSLKTTARMAKGAFDPDAPIRPFTVL